MALQDDPSGNRTGTLFQGTVPLSQLWVSYGVGRDVITSIWPALISSLISARMITRSAVRLAISSSTILLSD